MTPDRAVPVGATYRLQLSADFDFAAAAACVPYLAALGVSHVYLSPVLTARPGSTHGYDVVDPATVSEALGGRAGLEALADTAAGHGLGLVLDIVPNHVATSDANPLWDALLAEGPSGSAAGVFDVDWTPPLPGAQDRVILPVLGAPYGQVLYAGELTVTDGDRGLRVRYHEHSFPVSAPAAGALQRSGGPAALAGKPGRPETWTRLHALLESQHYRLVHWRVGDALVNYRRFFAISDLAAVRVEDEAVYERTHGTILELLRAGLADGVRVDHVDGLADPAGYLERLRRDAGEAWIVVEKILAAGEALPGWPVSGTTGYDFLGDVLRLHVDPAAEPAFTALAGELGAWPQDYAGAVREAKRDVLAADLAADLELLTSRLWALCQRHVEVRDVTRTACAAALAATLAEQGTYRTYVRAGQEPAPADAARLRSALDGARARTPGVPAFLWDFLGALLSGAAGADEEHGAVVRRFQQLSAAVMAKGVEDTFLYRQHRLDALNEVGVEPDCFGAGADAFHEAAAARADRHPGGLLSTATHDTKRGEDTRLRIAALTELAERWTAAVRDWGRRHAGAVRRTDRGPAPEPATAYLVYQTLVGVWPLQDARDRLGELRERVRAYAVKAAREDGRRTSWSDPDRDYEQALEGFVDALLDPADGAFLDELAAVAGEAAEIAIVSGLAQTLLRCTSPGVPDTYQGTELWEDNLVDPDNRRPVDFDRRARLLEALDREPCGLAELVAARRDGRVKLWVLSRALRARRDHPEPFGTDGAYVPLRVRGRFADHVVAFARRGRGGEAAVVVAPRLPGAVMAGCGRPPLGTDWGDTAVATGADLAGRGWSDALGGPGAPAGQWLVLSEVLTDLPVALLVGS